MQDNWIKDLKNNDPNIRRRAIKGLAESRNVDAMKILKSVYEQDSDPQIRELAKRAGAYLWKSLNGAAGAHINNAQINPPNKNTAQPGAASSADKSLDSLQSLREDFIQKTSPYPKPKPASPAAPDLTGTEPQSAALPKTNSNNSATAETHINRATAMLVKGNKTEAIRSLQLACKINPELLNDDIAQNLAAELTGQSGQQAIQSVMAIKSVSSRNTKKSQSGITLYLLLGSIVVLTVALILFFQSGLGSKYQTFFLLSSLEKYEQNINGYDVYIIPPSGKPPEEGWPVVVGLHGYGCLPEQMLVYTKKFTRKGILYITPSFGTYYTRSAYDGPIGPLTSILKEASNQYPINQDNVVLIGLSRGGEFAYRFSTAHPEWVKGVVTSGATGIDIYYLPDSKTMPYSFSWNATDDLQYYVIPNQVNPLINQGYNVTLKIVEGTDFNINPYDIEQAIQISKQ